MFCCRLFFATCGMRKQQTATTRRISAIDWLTTLIGKRTLAESRCGPTQRSRARCFNLVVACEADYTENQRERRKVEKPRQIRASAEKSPWRRKDLKFCIWVIDR
jgi:hypothetical protein